ncbi:MAG: phytanoyl-CoA dioxygenase family protein [Tepidisphaeraceae bacterium]
MSTAITPTRVENPVKHLRLSDGEIRFYRDEGFLLIPGLLSETTARALAAEVMEIMNQIGGAEGSKLKQTAEYLEGSGLDAFVNSPNLRKIAEQLMDGPGTLYLPFTAVKGPGGGKFHFHQDGQYTKFDGPGINLWCALDEMTPENGCLMIVPRSHKGGLLESVQSPDGDNHRAVKFEPDDFLPIRMRPGDCVAFTRLTVHGSGPNTTPGPRVGYAVQFHRNDTLALRDDGTWKNLREFPRFATGPVKQIAVPKGKVDGH